MKGIWNALSAVFIGLFCIGMIIMAYHFGYTSGYTTAIEDKCYGGE